jgi:TRAP-type C4-dicarboxylate transport system permease small subunit
MLPVIELSNEKVVRVTRVYTKWITSLAEILWKVSIGVSVLLLLVVLSRILSRALLGSVPVWSGEVSSYLAIWMTWMLIGVLIHHDDHLQVYLVYQKFPEGVKYWIRMVQLIAIAAFGFEFAYQGYLYALTSGTRSTFVTLSIDMLWAYMILPLAGVLMVLFSTAKVLELLIDPSIIEKDYERKFSSGGV